MGLGDTVEVDELHVRQGLDTPLKQAQGHHLPAEYDLPVIIKRNINMYVVGM